MQWFRLYHEMLEDPKIGTLTDKQFRLWIDLLCLASLARNENGKSGGPGDTKMTVTETEWKLRRNINETLQELLHRKLVTFQKRSDGSETIAIPKWEKRQFQSDSSTERVNKYREKRRMKRYSNGECNDDVPF